MNSKGFWARGLFALSILAALFLFSHIQGCSSDDNGKKGASDDDVTADDDDSGVPGDDDSGVPDDDDGVAGDDDAAGDDDGPVIKNCNSTADCPSGQICEPDTRTCKPTTTCEQDLHCFSAEYPNADYIRCLPEGICKPIRHICQPCIEDGDCGTDSDKCINVGGGTFCGKAPPCPQGFIQDTNQDGQCVPGDGQCIDVPTCQTDEDCPGSKCTQVPGAGINVCANYCKSDSECPREKICNRDTGYCIDRCDPEEENACPPGEACHVNGKCGPVCASDADCDHYAEQFPEVGVRCEVEEGRCRVNGCVADAECPFPGYCDTNTYECMDGFCRTETDCLSGNYCVEPGFVGAPMADDASCEEGREPPCQCKAASCTAKGAWLLCPSFNFCCGEDPNRECPQEAVEGECYRAQTPPYCVECDPNAEDPCPEADGYSGHCLQLQDADGNSKGNYCGVPCGDKFDCPVGMSCDELQDENGSPVANICNPLNCPNINPPTNTGGGTQPPP